MMMMCYVCVNCSVYSVCEMLGCGNAKVSLKICSGFSNREDIDCHRGEQQSAAASATEKTFVITTISIRWVDNVTVCIVTCRQTQANL
jgi:hypothetical protein